MLRRFHFRLSSVVNEISFTNHTDTVIPTFAFPTKNLSETSSWPFSVEEAKRYFDLMVQVQVIDTVLYDVQRQGRISFYMQNSGEEACQVGTAAALKFEDVIWPQYRELGVYLYRGFTVKEITDQCAGNQFEVGKGRQMPVHYCFPKGNIHAVTSPLGTSIPHAVGAGYTFRLEGIDRVAVSYFGDGAASEGDFPTALNFAATLGSQVLFFCRNNGYAISTPTSEQYAGDGIAARGPAFGVPSLRVDGNDLFAVYSATQAARKLCVDRQGPVIVEFMTYRRGHHSTSDDSTKYRSADEIVSAESSDPIARMRSLLSENSIIDSNYEAALRKTLRQDLLTNLKASLLVKKSDPLSFFNDVYEQLPPHLLKQRQELKEHIEKYASSYKLGNFEPLK